MSSADEIFDQLISARKNGRLAGQETERKAELYEEETNADQSSDKCYHLKYKNRTKRNVEDSLELQNLKEQRRSRRKKETEREGENLF